MALGNLPYRAKVISKAVDSGGLGRRLTIEIRDADNSLRDTREVSFGAAQSVAEVRAAIDDQVQSVIAQDAGSLDAFLDSLVAGVSAKQWASGDPAYIPDTITLNGTSIRTWTNMPVGLTELPGSRFAVDLSLARQARLSVDCQLAAFAGARLGLQFSTDGGSNWSYLDGGNGPNVLLTTAGVQVSPWVVLVAAARADVLIRVGGVGGNGVVDPQVGVVLLQVR